MRWDTYDPEIREHAGLMPGGTDLVDALTAIMEFKPGQNVLDLCPGNGVVSALVAKEFQVDVTSIVDEAEEEAQAEASAKLVGMSDRVRVIPGAPVAIPVPSDEFQRIFCIGQPFLPPPVSELAKELYRVVSADGIVGLAGPAAMTNAIPDYMRDALEELGGIKLRTPAYTALHFSHEGFHILNAEFLPEAWDHWMAWLGSLQPEAISDKVRNAFLEDGGRWLSLGLIILRKPPRPGWAV